MMCWICKPMETMETPFSFWMLTRKQLPHNMHLISPHPLCAGEPASCGFSLACRESPSQLSLRMEDWPTLTHQFTAEERKWTEDFGGCSWCSRKLSKLTLGHTWTLWNSE
jgi:hypothetical protein